MNQENNDLSDRINFFIYEDKGKDKPIQFMTNLEIRQVAQVAFMELTYKEANELWDKLGQELLRADMEGEETV